MRFLVYLLRRVLGRNRAPIAASTLSDMIVWAATMLTKGNYEL